MTDFELPGSVLPVIGPTDSIALVAAIYSAMNAVHAITGRTDQSLTQIVELFPDHPDVKKYLDAVKAYRDALGLDDAIDG